MLHVFLLHLYENLSYLALGTSFYVKMSCYFLLHLCYTSFSVVSCHTSLLSMSHVIFCCILLHSTHNFMFFFPHFLSKCHTSITPCLQLLSYLAIQNLRHNFSVASSHVSYRLQITKLIFLW